MSQAKAAKPTTPLDSCKIVTCKDDKPIDLGNIDWCKLVKCGDNGKPLDLGDIDWCKFVECKESKPIDLSDFPLCTIVDCGPDLMPIDLSKVPWDFCVQRICLPVGDPHPPKPVLPSNRLKIK